MTLHQKVQQRHHAIVVLEQELDEARAQCQELERRCQTLSKAVITLQQMAHVLEDALGEDAIPPVDLRGCRNPGERLHAIAMVTGGVVDLAKAVDVMQSSWPTDAKRETLDTDVRRWIRKHPDDWEKIAPGIYRYLRYENCNGASDDDH